MTTQADLRAAFSITNVKAFYAVIRHKESTNDETAYTLVNLAAPDDPARGVRGHHFSSFADHPYAGLSTRALDPSQRGYAAGAPQFIPSTWAEEKARYGFADFSPPNQDLGYVARLIYRGALDDVIAGKFESAVAKCRAEWSSLPGASESRADWTLAKAKALFLQYAGGVSDESTDQPTGGPMADAVETVAGIASIFNPLAGGVIGLAGNIFKAFQPALQAKVAKEINRRTDDPSIGNQAASDIASSLAQMVLSQAKVLTGHNDDFKAAAAITTDPTQSENLQKLQESVDAHVETLMKVGDKSTQWDQALWAAQNEGKHAVSTIAIEEKRAGLYDMTRLLVWTGAITTTAGSAMMLIAIIVQSMSWVFAKDTKGIDPVLLALAGPLLTIAYQCWKDIISYRFDGSKASSDQTKAMYQQAISNNGVSR